MSRITGSEAKNLMEAYSAVYAPQELTEEQVWEEVESWVNSLIEEGYDLSEYTWEEMYETYFSEDIKKDSESAGGAFRRWAGARVREVGDIIGSGYKGIVGQETSSSNPASRISNAMARGGTAPIRDVIAPFVAGAIKNTKSEPKEPTVTKPAPSKQPQPDSAGKFGEYLAPTRGSSKAADPVVRSGGSYGFFGANKPPSVTKPTPPSQPPLNGVKRGPRGGIVLNQVEVDYDRQIVEAEAQVAPITGSAGKEWMQKGKDGKWYPITDLELAKKSKERWEKESKRQSEKSTRSRLDDPIAGKGPRGNEVGSTPPAPTPPQTPPATTSSQPRPAAAPKPATPSAAAPSRPSSSATASTADKIKGGMDIYNKQRSSGDFTGASETGKSVWALANPKLAAAAAERARTRGTSSTTNPQMQDMKSRLPAAAPKDAPKPTPAPDARAIAARASVANVTAPSSSSTPTPAAPKAPSLQQSIRNRRLNMDLDMFDVIRGHLLDEGYADTEEAAEAIMANMSEEWRHSILVEDPVQDYRDMKRSQENAAGMRGPELSYSSKGTPKPGSATQKLQPRSREFEKVLPGTSKPRGREFTNPPS